METQLYGVEMTQDEYKTISEYQNKNEDVIKPLNDTERYQVTKYYLMNLRRTGKVKA